LIKIKNCAIYGGSFDPIHNGHIHLIKALLNSSKFEKLIVLPAGSPWQKKTHADSKMRLEMLKLALEGIDVEISECELRRSGPSYALDTVVELGNEFPAEKFTWVLGSDAFTHIESWHRAEELATLVDFLVVVRPGAPIKVPALKLNYEVIEVDALDVSATEIRERIASHQSVEEFLPDRVARFIKMNGLYGAA